MPTYRLTISNGLPAPPRVSLHSVCDTTPACCVLMAVINFVLTSSNSRTGKPYSALSLHSPAGRAATVDHGRRKTYGYALVPVVCMGYSPRRALRCGQGACVELAAPIWLGRAPFLQRLFPAAAISCCVLPVARGLAEPQRLGLGRSSCLARSLSTIRQLNLQLS